MAELTLDQQKAVVLAKARLRLAEKPSSVPAQPFGDPAGNYTREMSPGQIAGNQLLNVFEGMGIDPQSPIAGSLRNYVEGTRGMISRIEDSPVLGTLGAAKDIAMMPVNAVKDLASGNAEQAARGAGEFFVSTPIAAAELGAVRNIGKAAVSRLGNTALPSKVMSAAATARQTVAKPSPVAASEVLAHPVGSVVRAVARPVVNAAARGAEEFAKLIAKRESGTTASASAPSIVPDEAVRGLALEESARRTDLRQPDQYRPQFTDPVVSEQAPLGITRPKPGEIPQLPQPEAVNPLKAVEEAISPSGLKAREFTQLINGDGTPTKFGAKLLEVTPEIQKATKDTAPGILKTAFDSLEKNIAEAESKIPDETPVSAEPIADKIASIIEDYAGDERSVAQLTKEWDRWAGQKSLPWEEFIKIKRNVGKNLASPALRRAYRVLVDASTEISDDLRIANENYSTVRRAMRNGGIDTRTGRRISTVGKQ